MKKLRLGCVVMAAGDSKRFKGNKLLALYDGRMLIERALQAVPDKEFHRVVVVSQYPEILDMAKRYGFVPVLNSAPEEGVSLTIRLGLDALGKVDGAMFMVADQPLLTKSSVEAEIDFFKREPTGITAMAYGKRRGNPAIFPKDLFVELRELRGDVGGSMVICAHPDKLRLYQIEEELELCDTDSVEELDNLKRKKES
ncbi:MAG: nucleotidyltransferase family protein [Clostridia bacterium]|nr:nucleotidyltransferase family protein [Clostridia bacterium]